MLACSLASATVAPSSKRFGKQGEQEKADECQ
jgi:hypothetical protein